MRQRQEKGYAWKGSEYGGKMEGRRGKVKKKKKREKKRQTDTAAV